ncbi:hypothetical protein B0H14DRAFT_2941297 [Mycena olivaceomarginata]|nr:hypothetical protein B0H14DRAFT_2941297 [Mycena olivaceomarginata]
MSFLRSPVNSNAGYLGISKYASLIYSPMIGTATLPASAPGEWPCGVSEEELRRLPDWAQPTWLQEKIQQQRRAMSVARRHSAPSPELQDSHAQLLHQLEDLHLITAGYLWDNDLEQWIHAKRTQPNPPTRKPCRRQRVREKGRKTRDAREAAKSSKMRRSRASSCGLRRKDDGSGASVES